MFGKNNHQNREVLGHDGLAINEYVYQKSTIKGKRSPAKLTVKEIQLDVAFSIDKTEFESSSYRGKRTLETNILC